MNLVSLDPRSGDAAIIGLPRNLVGSPMPPGPLRELYPQGFPGLLNSVYTWGASRSEIVVDALGATDEPGASLVTASVSELTGLRIDAFVLVDMQGFIEVVDAFGGVDIYAPRDLPAPGNVPGGKHPVKDIKQGWNRMDGTDTLSFVRSRKADSDYWRMGRQRCVLASLAAQATPVDIALRWPAISSALAERVRTNLTPELLEALVSAVGKDPSPTRSLALVPPRFLATRWTLEDVRAAVAYTVTGSTPVSETTPADASSPQISSTTLQPQSSTSTPAPAEVAEECRIRP
jgi:LCP family protein required for cell wall assembly